MERVGASDDLLEARMTASTPANVCIIIAAKNAADTIARAIASALAEPEATEVVVIDDGSTDDTAAAARGADDGTGRLNIVRFDENRGPAAARNHAISISRSPLLGILDADDFFFLAACGNCSRRTAGTSSPTTSPSSMRRRRRALTARSTVSHRAPASSTLSALWRGTSRGAVCAAAKSGF